MKLKILAFIFLTLNTVRAMQTHDKDGNPLSEEQRKLNGELRMAIYRSDPEKANSVLFQGADPNAYDDRFHKFTLFMLAVEYYGLLINDSKREKRAQVIQKMMAYGR